MSWLAGCRYLVAAALCCGAAFAQSTPPPATAATKGSEPLRPVHFDVNLVEVDAVVTDSQGHHIDGLNAADFEVRQDGKPQNISHFRFVPGPGTQGLSTPAAALPMSTGLSKPALRRTFVVFMDDITTSFGDYAVLRRELLKFVDTQLQEGDLWAFYKSSGGSGAWQVFSSDHREIRSAVEHLTWLPPSPYLVQNHAYFFEMQMKRAIAALAALPGRKSIILVNSGFYADFLSMANVIQAVQRMSDFANRASVTIQAIDLRGLPVGAGIAGNWADASHRYAQQNPLLPGSVLQTGAASSNPLISRPMAYMMSQTLVAERLAKQTGGLFLHDRNDFSTELKIAENDDAGYYVLGWDPGSTAFLGRRYHDLEVKVQRRGLTVRSRAGFFPWPGFQEPAAPYSAEQQMQATLFSPFRSGDIDVELNAGFQHTGRDGSYIESKVHVAPKGIGFEETSPGCFVANLELVITPRPLSGPSDPGHLTSQMTRLEACGRTGQTLLRDGFVYRIRSRIDRPGPYEMRVAIRNTAPGDKVSIGPKTLIARDSMTPPVVTIGSATQFVEVPDLKKKPFSLSGIELNLTGVKVPEAIPGGTEGQTFEMSYRPPVAGDPAVRRFRPGDLVSYSATLFGSKDAHLGATIQILREGQPVHSEPVESPGQEIRGTYRIDPDAAPGHYLLGITAEKQPGKKNSRETSQWIDFEVLK